MAHSQRGVEVDLNHVSDKFESDVSKLRSRTLELVILQMHGCIKVFRRVVGRSPMCKASISLKKKEYILYWPRPEYEDIHAL